MIRGNAFSSLGAQSVMKEEFVSKAYWLWLQLHSCLEGLKKWRKKKGYIFEEVKINDARGWGASRSW